MTAKTTILLIEDEEYICSFISSTLTANGYKVLTSVKGRDGLIMAASHCPDLLLLDLGLPDIEGIDVLNDIRSWSSMPVIIISARTQEKEKVIALDAGADDYITKPFGTSELLARIRTALRHSRVPETGGIYRCKELSIDFLGHQVLRNGEDIHLTQVEYKIVALLAENAGKVLTYDTMISRIWGPFADTNNRILRVNMANIRRKIEKNPADPEYIYTEIGVGYRMSEED